jgi:hypothetical protein
MIQDRDGQTATRLTNGQVLMVGGVTETTATQTTLASAELAHT